MRQSDEFQLLVVKKSDTFEVIETTEEEFWRRKKEFSEEFRDAEKPDDRIVSSLRTSHLSNAAHGEPVI